MFIDLKARVRNFGFWAGIFFYGALINQLAGMPINVGKYDLAVKIILGILGLLGVINNPTSTNQFLSDDKPAEPPKNSIPLQ